MKDVELGGRLFEDLGEGELLDSSPPIGGRVQDDVRMAAVVFAAGAIAIFILIDFDTQDALAGLDSRRRWPQSKVHLKEVVRCSRCFHFVRWLAKLAIYERRAVSMKDVDRSLWSCNSAGIGMQQAESLKTCTRWHGNGQPHIQVGAGLGTSATKLALL